MALQKYYLHFYTSNPLTFFLSLIFHSSLTGKKEVCTETKSETLLYFGFRLLCPRNFFHSNLFVYYLIFICNCFFLTCTCLHHILLSSQFTFPAPLVSLMKNCFYCPLSNDCHECLEPWNLAKSFFLF